MAPFAEVLLNLPLDRAFTYRIPPALQDRVRPGVRVEVPFRNRMEKGFVSGLSSSASFPNIRDIASASDEVTADEPLRELARWMADRYGCSWGEALNTTIPTGVKAGTGGRMVRLLSAGEGAPRSKRQGAALEFARGLDAPLPAPDFIERSGASAAIVSAMVKAGLLKEERVRAEVDAMADAVVEAPREINLTDEQKAALETVAAGGVTLLHGVTGSGKTEVYLRAIARVVEAGRQAIVLVPEIALTPQTVSRFRARFPRVAVLHSVLSEGDRAAQWRAARAGEVDVIVGARSAVFAPVQQLGLIVVDEEHEGAYKQDTTPRYHAREVAVHRAETEGAAVILGSATPSLESIHAARTGRYRWARLTRRIDGLVMPEIEVVDMGAERRDIKRFPVISRLMEKVIRGAMERKEQVILFLNRRGFLTQISCPRCDWVLRCRRCAVSMTYHRATERAVCHYCSDSKPMPDTCGECGARKLLQLGLGTERIESEVKRLFPGFAISRMDSDSMRSKKDYRESLASLWGGKTDILVGTQMIAKGLDVPDVTVVGVVSADTAFHLPDFRAAERTFQIITQVAGRAGRGRRGGRVVVQSFNADHYAIKMAASYDHETFWTKELAMREELGYPPFCSLARIVVAGTNEDFTRESAERLGKKLRATVKEDAAEILGPAPAPLTRLKGRYRMHFLVKAKELAPILPALRKIVLAGAKGRTIQTTLDVDPMGML